MSISVKKGSKLISKTETSNSNIRIALQAQEGLDADSFFQVAKLSGYKKEELAGLLHTSLKTLDRYRKDKKTLDPASSEWVLKITLLFNLGQRVFSNQESFKKWLDNPSLGLGNMLPFQLLQTITGIELVQDELTRIAYGDLA